MQRTNFSTSSDPQIEFLAIEAFKSEGFLIVNKTLIQNLGLIPAILLSNYIDKHIYFKKQHPENNGWFYLTHEQQMEQIGIGEHSVIKYKNFLKSKGILKTKRCGIPAKEWVCIDFQKLVECFKESIKTLDPSISGGQDTLNLGGLYKDKETNIIKENKSNRERRLPTRKIIPPPMDALVKYCQERNNKVDPQMFYDFYQSKGWKIGKDPMRDWQAAVRTWEQRNNHYVSTSKLSSGSRSAKSSEGGYKYRGPDAIHN